MKTYRNAQHGFEIDIPDHWSFHSGETTVHSSGKDLSLIFKCGSSEAFNIQIGSLKSEPALEQTEDDFARYAHEKGYTSLGLNRITVAGKEHVWARYYMGGGLWSKKYMIVLNGIEYAFTATCLDQKFLLEMERGWDTIAKSFRLIASAGGLNKQGNECPQNTWEAKRQIASDHQPGIWKIYRNDELGFEFRVPEEWSVPKVNTPALPSDKSIIFDCGPGESFNLQIGPLLPEPTLDFTERKFREYALNNKYNELKFGRITVEGRPHLWASYSMGLGGWTKKYLIVLGGIEYAITAACFDLRVLAMREKVWDAIVASFRLDESRKQFISEIKAFREETAGQLYAKAYQAVSDECYSEARSLLEQCLSNNPEHVLAHKELAVVLKKLGDLRGALSHRQAVKRLDPSDVVNRYNLADLLAGLGEKEAVLEEVRELQMLAPNHPEVRRLVNLVNQAQAQQRLDIQPPVIQKADVIEKEVGEVKSEQAGKSFLGLSLISYSAIIIFAFFYIHSRVPLDVLLSLKPGISGSGFNLVGIVLLYGIGALICWFSLVGVIANRMAWNHAVEIFNLIEMTMRIKEGGHELFGGVVFSDYTRKPAGIFDVLRLQVSNLIHALIKISLVYFSVGLLGPLRSFIVAMVVFGPRLILHKPLPILWDAGVALFWFYSCYRTILFWLAKRKGVSRENDPANRERVMPVSLPGTAINFAVKSGVTPPLIQEILANGNIIQAIKADLARTGQIGYKEVWQLGLISPDQDRFDPRPDPLPLSTRTGKYLSDPNYRYHWLEQIPLKRTAVLNSKSYFNVQLNNLLIYNGRLKYMGYPGWSYRLSNNLDRGEFMNIRDIRIDATALHAQNRALSLLGFLREDGFPLKETYLNGDPLTTERDGTIIIDRERVMIIHPKYFVQRRLIDDEGNLIEMGLEEEFALGALTGIKLRPSVSELLFRDVTSHGYTPVLRYRSFPYSSDFMFPILDTPMSASGWADLYIDPYGKGKLFIARQKTEAEWYEMLAKLKELFYGELAKKDYHLLGLTKDKSQLNEYLYKKQEILKGYYVIQDWQLP